MDTSSCILYFCTCGACSILAVWAAIAGYPLWFGFVVIALATYHFGCRALMRVINACRVDYEDLLP